MTWQERLDWFLYYTGPVWSVAFAVLSMPLLPVMRLWAAARA